ncbi:MAG: fibronectin type III domain-containing protein [Minisyncoccia bacterium]
MTDTFRKLTVFSLVLAILLAPALSFAHDNDNGKKKRKSSDRSERVEINDDRDDDSDDDDDDKDDNRRSDRQEDWTKKKSDQALAKSCRQVFKRLFGHGFLANNADIADLIECLRPFGVNATFTGTASSTVDTVAPILSNISAKPNTLKAVITWNTNEKSDSTVFWSATAGVNVNSSTTASVTKSDRVKEHKIVLENLTASTTYYFIVRSKDAAGNVSTSSELSFATKSLVADVTAPTISNVTLLVASTSATVSWQTNENATSKVYYGTSASLDVNATSTNFLENTSLKQSHALNLSGLSTSTLYYFAAESRDGSGNRTVTPVFSASTSN